MRALPNPEELAYARSGCRFCPYNRVRVFYSV